MYCSTSRGVRGLLEGSVGVLSSNFSGALIGLCPGRMFSGPRGGVLSLVRIGWEAVDALEGAFGKVLWLLERTVGAVGKTVKVSEGL